MEAAWRALAVEQDWLDGEIVQNGTPPTKPNPYAEAGR
jgi:hypothetical protein